MLNGIFSYCRYRKELNKTKKVIKTNIYVFEENINNCLNETQQTDESLFASPKCYIPKDKIDEIIRAKEHAKKNLRSDIFMNDYLHINPNKTPLTLPSDPSDGNKIYSFVRSGSGFVVEVSEQPLEVI